VLKKPTHSGWRHLSGHDVIFVNTSDEARTLLEQEEYALVIRGAHFDESQMLSPRITRTVTPTLTSSGKRWRYLERVLAALALSS
jgi:hypothetical protein